LGENQSLCVRIFLESDDGVFVWQPQVAQRANDATLLPHILQVIQPDLLVLLALRGQGVTIVEFVGFFQHVLHYADVEWL
jgi:hypothetical protein